MNELLTLLNLQHWKPVATALLLPPLPFLLLAVLGARLMFRRRGLAWLLVLLATAGLWASGSSGVAQALLQVLQPPQMALSSSQLAELRRAQASGRKLAVVVLGGGAEMLAPEYGVSNLSPQSLARLRYGLWLGRQTGTPVMFSGGMGWGQPVGVPEAESAARIAEQDFRQPLKWQEGQSRDTRGNATRSLTVLAPAAVNEVLLVTDGWHMRRAMRAFEHEAQRLQPGLKLRAAPMGLSLGGDTGLLRWLPSGHGYWLMNRVLREQLGWWAGA